jgi:DnaJ-class molecular chaperone
MSKCQMCEGKGYYNLSATYDDIHSRVQCNYCMGDGYENDEKNTESEE